MTGNTGYTGSQGIQGNIGYTGSQGVQGIAGYDGSIGFTGSQGIQGVTGYTGSIGATGDTGFTGSQGVQGTSGYTGSIGATGYVGSIGATGTTGFTGSQGVQGNIGYTGSQGNQGNNGYTGSQGTSGYTGSVGSQGNIGYTGSQGVQGNIGYTGSQGIQGNQGNAGYTGSQGSQGVSGYTGSQGSQGVIGYTGSKGQDGTNGYDGSAGTNGYIGSVGNTGFTGSIGSTGYVGSKGDQGIQGPQGSFGGETVDYIFNTSTSAANPGTGQVAFNSSDLSSAAYLYINQNDNYGSNTYNFLLTIDASTSSIKGHFMVKDSANNADYAMFAITGAHSYSSPYLTVPVSYLSGATSFNPSQNVILTFAVTGDRGDVGYTGSVGSAGYNGSQGIAGYTGSKGDTGFTGSQGVIGYTGSKGDQGNTGYVGSIGATGTTGYVGSTGNQGNAGFTGSIGSSGYTGSTGLSGYTGSKGDLGYTGSIGFSGSQGINGYVGSKGDQGIGYTGSVGAVGYTGSIGITGDTGYTGSQGIQGNTGYIGSIGATGYVGSIGATGAVGYTGSKGDQGVTGYIGSTGQNGATGYTGSIGATGGLGYTGSTGTFASGQNIVAGNITINGTLTTNGTSGSPGQALYSNGIGVYWANTPTTVSYSNVTVTTITANSLSADAINIGVGWLTVGNSTVNTVISNSGIRVSSTSSNVVLSLTDFRVPVGNTAQRPANAAVGYIRFNTDITDLEYAVNSTKWYSITTQDTLTSNNINITNLINIGNTAVNTTISSSNISTTYVNTKYIVANNSTGSNGQVLTSNSTGGIYWANSLNVLVTTDITTNTLSADSLNIGKGFLTVGNSTVNTQITNSSIITLSITANGTTGVAGSVLTSNGNGMYWSNTVTTLQAQTITAGTLAADSMNIGSGWLTIGNATVNSVITNTTITTSIASIQTAYFTSDLSAPFTTYSTVLDSSTPKSVSFAGVALNSAAGVGYTVEFYVKFTSISSGAQDAYGSTGVNSLGWSANSSSISLYNNGYSNAGNVTGLNLQNNVWYHMAYIGYNGGTYFAINGVVTNLNNIGGYGAYTATGTWAGGWSKLTGNATYSNFRVLTGRNIYNINGFAPPTIQLTAVSGTQLLTLRSSTFVDISGYSRSVTTTGSPVLFVDNIALSSGVLTVAGSIQNGILNTPAIYTNYIYANNVLGTTGQVLGANSTGGVYWTTDQVSSSVSANVITANTLSSDYINIGIGYLTVGNSSVNTQVTNNGIYVGGNLLPSNSYIVATYVSNNYLLNSNIIYSGTYTFNANVVLSNSTVLFANGVAGTAGQTLTANATGGLYWSNSSTSYSVTSNVVTSNIITTNILSSDFISIGIGNLNVGNSTSNSVLANTGLIVSNILANTVYGVGITANNTLGSAGQVLASNGSGIYWTTVTGGSGGSGNYKFTSSNTAPSSPSVGDRWYNTDYGIELVFVQDPNGAAYQWVDMSSGGQTGATGPIGYAGSQGAGYTGSQGASGASGATIPATTQSGNYTLQSSDNGNLIVINTGNTTVPAGVFTAGQNVTIFNNNAASMSIIQGSGVTMYYVSSTTGTRTLGGYGLTTVLSINSTTFVITGGVLT